MVHWLSECIEVELFTFFHWTHDCSIIVVKNYQNAMNWSSPFLPWLHYILVTYSPSCANANSQCSRTNSNRFLTIFTFVIPVRRHSFRTECNWCRMHVLWKCCHKQISLLFVKQLALNILVTYWNYEPCMQPTNFVLKVLRMSSELIGTFTGSLW